MIQRIQSLYLALVCLFTSFMLVQPVGVFKIKQSSQEKLLINNMFTLSTQADSQNAINVFYLACLAIAVVATALITVFLFRKRNIQIRLCRINFLLVSLLIALVYFVMDLKVKNMFMDSTVSTTFLLGAYMPLIDLILLYLAITAIKKDDELVRSADRLR